MYLSLILNMQKLLNYCWVNYVELMMIPFYFFLHILAWVFPKWSKIQSKQLIHLWLKMVSFSMKRNFKKIYLFILIGGYLLYNMVMVFVIHQYELAIGIHVSLPSWTPLPLHPIPPRCHRAPALGALNYTSNSHWLSVSHLVIYVSMLFWRNYWW